MLDAGARRLLALLLFALLPSSAQAVSLVDRVETWWERFWHRPPYPISDSGYFVDADAHPNRLYWLDNDRVIFSGNPLDVGRREARTGKRPARAIHIWNVRTGEVTYYGEGISPPCVHDGFIYYLTQTSPEVYSYKEGPFSKEVEVVEPGYRTAPDHSRGIPHRSVLDCRLYFPKDLPGPGDGWTRPLLYGHGYLSITGIGGTSRPATLIKPGGVGSVPLPLRGDEVDGDRIQYAAWADAYLLYSDLVQRRNPAGDKPKYLPPRVVLMAPSGTVTELEVPYRDWLSADKGFVYTRRGLVLWSQATRPGGLGHSGVHLVDGSATAHLLRGHVRAVGVSPDGCIVAAAVKVSDAEPARLRAVNLCEQKR